MNLMTEVTTQAPAAPPDHVKPVARRHRTLMVASVLIVVGVIASIAVVGRGRAQAEYFAQPVTRGDIDNVVTATGTVQAVVTVDVGSQVSGKIESLYADYNSQVKRGQVLARIDPRPFQAQLANATADLAAARAHVRTMEADVVEQHAGVKAARASLEDARAARDVANVTLQRNATLLQRGLVARSDYDAAKAAADQSVAKYNQALAALEQAQAQTTSSEADLAQARAQAEQARAAVETSQLNLSYATISSPVDGVVVARSVDVGQTVAASLQAPLLFVIANDLTKMQVNASVDEADVGQLSEHAPVTFFVDAYPHDIFTGRIAEIRLNPQTVQNVVTYSVIIDVDNPQLKLRPGMTANVTVTIARRSDVLKIPNAALRYEPAGVTRAQLAAMLAGRPAAPPGEWRAELPAAGEGGTATGTSADRASAAPHGRTGSPPDAAATPGTVASSTDRRGTIEAPRSGGTSQSPLAPGQHWNLADKIRFPPEKAPDARPAIVWVLDSNGKPAPRTVLIGVTDGVSTEIVSGQLREGDHLVIADTSQNPTLRSGAANGRGRAMFRF
jgi:HlyD family secretion protein